MLEEQCTSWYCLREIHNDWPAEEDLLCHCNTIPNFSLSEYRQPHGDQDGLNIIFAQRGFHCRDRTTPAKVTYSVSLEAVCTFSCVITLLPYENVELIVIGWSPDKSERGSEKCE